MTVSPASRSSRWSKAPPPVCTVCAVITAEPFFAPGLAPSDHQPTSRGFDGGSSAPSRAVMPTTFALTPSWGTVMRCGRPGTVAGRTIGTLDARSAAGFECCEADADARGADWDDGGRIDGSAVTDFPSYSSTAPTTASATPATTTSQPHRGGTGRWASAPGALVMVSDSVPTAPYSCGECTGTDQHATGDQQPGTPGGPALGTARQRQRSVRGPAVDTGVHLGRDRHRRGGDLGGPRRRRRAGRRGRRHRGRRSLARGLARSLGRRLAGGLRRRLRRGLRRRLARGLRRGRGLGRRLGRGRRRAAALDPEDLVLHVSALGGIRHVDLELDVVALDRVRLTGEGQRVLLACVQVLAALVRRVLADERVQVARGHRQAAVGRRRLVGEFDRRVEVTLFIVVPLDREGAALVRLVLRRPVVGVLVLDLDEAVVARRLALAGVGRLSCLAAGARVLAGPLGGQVDGRALLGAGLARRVRDGPRAVRGGDRPAGLGGSSTRRGDHHDG